MPAALTGRSTMCATDQTRLPGAEFKFRVDCTLVHCDAVSYDKAKRQNVDAKGRKQADLVAAVSST